MNSNLGNTNVIATEEVESIGNGFITKYFDALMGKSNPLTLRLMFNEQSVYVFAQDVWDVFNRMFHKANGIQSMYGYHILKLPSERSVDTIVSPHLTEFKVLSICKLMRLGNDAPYKFTQTFVIRHIP
jgi:hypothetical protein